MTRQPATVPLNRFAFSSASAFAVAERPTAFDFTVEGGVRFLLVSGRRDEGSWGPVGAAWLAEDHSRGGFIVNPWALWEAARSSAGTAAPTIAAGAPNGSTSTGGPRSGGAPTRWTKSSSPGVWRCSASS